MKKTITTLAMASVLSVASYAQNYGELMYPHPNYYLSCGLPTNINSTGFISGTYLPSCSVEENNFIIDKSDDNGALSGSLLFSKGYVTMGSSNCNNSPSQVLDCYGVSVIEINPVNVGSPSNPQYAWYAVAGANTAGTFFATLDKNGVPLTMANYVQPNGIAPMSQPYIYESSSTPGEFLICGENTTSSVYALRVRANTSIVWSMNYKTPNCVLSPRDIIECPYSGDLTVIGYFDNAVRASDGFFMKIDANNGAVNVLKTYGHPNNACQEFNGIDVARSSAGGSKGFVVCGQTDAYNGNYGWNWFVKLDPMGNVIWDWIMLTSSGSGAAYTVIERANTPAGTFEYYGAGISYQGYTVMKLDDNGYPFSGGNNEFTYDAPSPNWSVPVQISYIPAGAPSPDEGFHVFGQDEIGSPNNSYIVNAYFNGVGGCQNNLMNMISFGQGPDNIYQPPYSTYHGADLCPFFSLYAYPLNTVPNNICGPSTSVPGGSNARTAVATGIKSLTGIEDNVSVFPNPTNGKATLSCPAKKEVAVAIYDSFGRLVTSDTYKPANGSGTVNVELDLKSLDLKPGVYFIKTDNGKNKTTRKITLTD